MKLKHFSVSARPNPFKTMAQYPGSLPSASCRGRWNEPVWREDKLSAKHGHKMLAARHNTGLVGQSAQNRSRQCMKQDMKMRLGPMSLPALISY